MQHIPLIYPLSLLLLLVFVFFTGAYAIAEAAVNEGQIPLARPAADDATSSFSGGGSADHQWYQDAAILVCPLH